MKTLIACLFLTGIIGCERASVEDECIEKINPDISCTYQYDPVCGCNGKTYGNACAAGAAGIRIVSKGECPSVNK